MGLRRNAACNRSISGVTSSCGRLFANSLAVATSATGGAILGTGWGEGAVADVLAGAAMRAAADAGRDAGGGAAGAAAEVGEEAGATRAAAALRVAGAERGGEGAVCGAGGDAARAAAVADAAGGAGIARGAAGRGAGVSFTKLNAAPAVARNGVSGRGSLSGRMAEKSASK